MGGLDAVARSSLGMLEPVLFGVSDLGGWLVAGVLVWSGVAKLRRPHLAALALIDFGATRRFDVRFGIALAGLELMLAFGLALPAIHELAIAASTVLFWVFSTAIYLNLRLGRRFACFCFGESDGQLSTKALARTTVLALLATFLLLGPAPRASSLMDLALQIVAAVAVLLCIRLGAAVPSLRLRHAHRGSAVARARGL